MSGYNNLSEIDDCWEIIDYLTPKHDDLLVDNLNHENMMMFSYKNVHFILGYNKESFLRLTLKDSAHLENSLDLLYELGVSVIEKLGKWPIYYDMLMNEKVNPTLEWHFEKSKSANEAFIRDLMNNELFDDRTECTNIRTFPKMKLKQYQENFGIKM